MTAISAGGVVAPLLSCLRADGFIWCCLESVAHDLSNSQRLETWRSSTLWLLVFTALHNNYE